MKKRSYLEVVCIGSALGIVVIIAISASRTSAKNRLAEISYSMMGFSKRSDFLQHSSVTKLSTAIGGGSDTRSTLVYFVTYAEPLPKETIFSAGYRLVTTSSIRDRLNSDLDSADYREGAISEIAPSEQLFQRVSVIEDILRTHTMILRDEGVSVLHFLEMDYEEDYSVGQNKTLNPTSDP